jgi:hypothetical protein
MSQTQADHLKTWHNLLRALDENAADLSHLETRTEKLRTIVALAINAFQDQAANTAAKQSATRRLEEVLSQGNKTVSFLHAGLREHYGNRSEKLTEFGLQPFRNRRPQPEISQPEGVKPTEA